MTLTDTDVRIKGMESLVTTLGHVDAERFVMLISKEPFDYTKWRADNLDNSMSVRELSQAAMQYSSDKYKAD